MISLLIGTSAVFYTIPVYEFSVILSLIWTRKVLPVSIISTLVIIFVALLSAIFTPISILTLSQFFGLLFISLILWVQRSVLDVERVLKSYAVASLIISAFALLDFAFQITDGVFMYKDTHRSLRISGNFQDPNFFSSSCVLALLIFSRYFHLRLIPDLAIHLIFILAIVLTQSRAGSLSLLLYLLVERRQYIVGLIPIVLYIFWNSSLEIVSTIADRASDFSSSGRTDIWKHYLKNEIFTPMGQFGLLATEDKASHNTLIQLFYHFGVIFGPAILFAGLANLAITRGNISRLVIFGPFFVTLDLLFTRMLVFLLILNYVATRPRKKRFVHPYNS